MPARLRLAASLAVLLCAGIGSAMLGGAVQAEPSEVVQGALRTPTARTGAPLRAEPKMGAALLGNVAHGTRLMVEQVQGSWLRVTTRVADGATKQGWLRANETVHPYSLTGAGREAAGLRSTGEISAAGRGFSEDIEKQFTASQSQLRDAYRQLDERVEPVKPSPGEVQAFAKEGRLGYPGRTR